MKCYIGIDPGQKGGIALVDSAGLALEYEAMPPTTCGVIYLLDQYSRMARNLDATPAMVIELAQPMPKQGGVSAFTYGRHFGMFEPGAVFLSMPYHEVRPAIWKKAMGLNSEKVNSILLCERLFPTVNLIRPRCTKAHDGIAEALLIAEWGRRQGL